MKVLLHVTCILSYVLLSFCGEHPDGESKVSRTQDALGNYHFSYKVANGEGEQFREEGTDVLGRVVGSYGLKHIDGTHRVVDYVADKDGFRASVRSNEPGLASAEAADATIVKSGHSVPLSVAATSDDRHVFGRRIDPQSSKVEYAQQENLKDESAGESRQRTFDDYRPLNPVAYYPTDTRISSLSPPSRQPVEPARSPRVLKPSNSESDSKPQDSYFPPINPHTALRPPYYLSRDRTTDDSYFPPTTSRKPYIPPYGGFDDDEEDPISPVDKRPSIELSPGSRKDHSSLPTLSPSRRFVPKVFPDNRNFVTPRFPPSSIYPRSPGTGDALPLIPHDDPPQNILFNPPSYDGRTGRPTVVLRAVPIPNGIQAVRVDPNTGRIYERLVYPLFLGHDGRPEYDRNILLHNDDISDDDEIRHDQPGYLDMPFSQRPFRGVRNQPPYGEDGNKFRNRTRNNNPKIDENSLSEPTAEDITWLKKQLALVEEFNRNYFTDRSFPNRFSDREHFPDSYPFDSDSRYPRERRIPESRLGSNSGLREYSREDEFPRREASQEDLAIEGSKQLSAKLQKDDDTPVKMGNDEKESEIKTL